MVDDAFSRTLTPDQVAEYEKLASFAGFDLKPGVAEALLEALAAGVTPTGLATVLQALCKRAPKPEAGAGAADTARPAASSGS